MNHNDSNKDKGGRRSFLKATGLATAGLAAGVPGAAAGKPKPTRELYQKGLDIRKKNGWDVDRWRHWLANHGFDFQYQDVAVYTPTPPNNDDQKGRQFGDQRTDNRVGTKVLDKDETWHYMTYSRPIGGADRFNFEWSLNDGWDDSGASPRDWPGMSFEHDYYNFSNDEEEDLGKYVSNSDRTDDVGSNYWTFEYNEDSHAFYTSGRFESYLDVPLYVESSTDDVRQIYSKYHHTWDNVEVDSISVSEGGVVSVTFKDSTKAWASTAWCEEEEMDSGETYLDKNPE